MVRSFFVLLCRYDRRAVCVYGIVVVVARCWGFRFVGSFLRLIVLLTGVHFVRRCLAVVAARRGCCCSLLVAVAERLALGILRGFLMWKKMCCVHVVCIALLP